MTGIEKGPPQQTHVHTTYLNRPGAFLAGLVLGGLASAGATLLWAPQSGYRTRAQIKYKAAELRDQTNEMVDDELKQVRETVQHVKDAVHAG